MRFRSLHHHTTYSFLDGYGLPESHVRRAGELDMASIACTDHGNISGHVQLETAAKAEGVKPIFGVEAYTGHVDESKTKRKNHLTVLAADAQGYRNLLGLVSRSWRDFYYAPTTGPQNLLNHRDGLIILSGCQGSLLSTSLVGGKNIDPNEASFERGLRVAERFRATFGDAYYLEVQAFPELETTCRINGFLEQISRKLHIPLVATKDVHYTKPSESELQKILHNTRGMNRQTLEQQAQSWGEKAYEVKLCPPISDKKIYEELRATGLSKQAAIDSILNTEEITDRCTVELPKMGALRFPIPQGFKTSHEVWLAWLKDGWEYRGIDAKPNRKEYIARLRREMEVIEGKDFLDYFLFVSDVVKFAKNRGIPVGPARGSAAASLVCYLLRITEVDPVFFSNLVFERFIDVTRKDLPDIDLDFDDERREEVRQYLIATYGVEYVGQIGTFIRYKSKNSLDDVARAHGIPLAALDPIKDVLIERSSGDLRSSATIEDTMEQFDQAKEVFERYPVLRHAFALEGNVRGMGVHAAGYIVSSKPLASVCAIYTRIDPDTGEVKTDEYGNQMQVISMDKIDAEAMNLLKIDALGLHTMALIRIALELIGMNLQDLYDLPLDDEDTLKGFQENDVVGIFQFDGRAMRSVNEEVRPTTFLEVCDVGALARPGPLHSGASVDYVDVKRGKERKSYHPLLDNIVAYTNGQIIYQEQILRIVMEIGKFDWTDAGYIRKIISKKLGDQEFNRQWEKFRSGATSQGVPEDVAKEIWQRCITAGSYAFNNAHCLSADTEVTLVGGHGRPGGSMTLGKLWHWIHMVLPDTPGKRNMGFPGPCLNCKQYTEKGKYVKGQCNRCACWRRDFLRRGRATLALDGDGQIRPRQIVGVFCNGEQEVFEVHFSNGSTLVGTSDHRVMTKKGWVKFKSLKEGSKVVVDDGAPDRIYEGGNRLTVGERSGVGWGTAGYVDGGYANWQKWREQVEETCVICGTTESKFETSHKDGDRTNNDWDNLQLLCPRCHRLFDAENNNSLYGGWHVGRNTAWAKVESVKKIGKQVVYDLEMEAPEHNYVANKVVTHNTVSYGMIGYWTMWLKRHHPLAFYTAALRKCPDSKTGRVRRLSLLRDAMAHSVDVVPPKLSTSGATWSIIDGKVQAGFSQIPGIGDKTAEAIVYARDWEFEGQIKTWSDFLGRKMGIGKVKAEKFEAFCEADDPMLIHLLPDMIERISLEIAGGKLGPLPIPSHKSKEVPQSKGQDTLVTWLGMIRHRNLRDLFEVNNKRGTPLVESEVKNPELREWVILTGEDETEQLSITIDRWKYPRFREMIWDIELGHDLLLVRGVKKGWTSWRSIYVQDMWVIDPDDEEDEILEEDIQ